MRVLSTLLCWLLLAFQAVAAQTDHADTVAARANSVPIASIALNVTLPSFSPVDSRISEILTPHFRFAVAPLSPNFSA